MSDSTNEMTLGSMIDKIARLEAELAACREERDNAIEKIQYASGFLSVDAIERNYMKSELTFQTNKSEHLMKALCKVYEYCIREDPPLYDVCRLVDDLLGRESPDFIKEDYEEEDDD